jgi:hypothetical protein
MKIYIYYLHLGDNQPIYIGKTNSLSIRLKSHKRNLGNNIFIEEIDLIPFSEWKFWEQHYISLFKSWGYLLLNKNPGGGGLSKMGESSKNLIKNKLIGREYPQEWKDKLSQIMTGKPKNHPPDRGKKISLAKKGKPNPKLREFKLGKSKPKIAWKIKQYDLSSNYIKTWESAKEAGEYLNINPYLIQAASRGDQKTAGGYKWVYEK